MTNNKVTRDAVAHLAALHQRKQDRLATTTPVQAVTPADDDGEPTHE